MARQKRFMRFFIYSRKRKAYRCGVNGWIREQDWKLANRFVSLYTANAEAEEYNDEDVEVHVSVNCEKPRKYYQDDNNIQEV